MSGPFSTALRERVTREVTAKVTRKVTAKVRREVTAKVRREVARQVRIEDAKKAAELMKGIGCSRQQMEKELVSNWNVSPRQAARIADAAFQPAVSD